MSVLPSFQDAALTENLFYHVELTVGFGSASGYFILDRLL